MVGSELRRNYADGYERSAGRSAFYSIWRFGFSGLEILLAQAGRISSFAIRRPCWFSQNAASHSGFASRSRYRGNLKNPWLALQCRSHPSPHKFPAIREFYREFCEFEARGDRFGTRNRCAAATFYEIPYAN